MKKLPLILYVAAVLLLLPGCRGELFSGHRDMEHLRPVQTVGLDMDAAGAVTMSVTAGSGPEGEQTLVRTATASGIETAADRLQELSPRDELFYAHVQYLLLGETMAAHGLDAVLDWVERSPAMRMDTPLLLVRGGAAALTTGTLGEYSDAAERLASLERTLRSRSQPIPTLRQTAAGLLERGWALCLAVEALPDGDAAAVVPAGLALLREGEAPVFLTQNEALGAELLENAVAGTHVPVPEGMVELIGADTAVCGVWAGDELTGLHVRCELEAGILELDAPTDRDALAAMLEDVIAGCLAETVRRSQTLSCDFLHLEDAVRASAPSRHARRSMAWDAVFPDLPVTVTVEADLGRGYDLNT